MTATDSSCMANHSSANLVFQEESGKIPTAIATYRVGANHSLEKNITFVSLDVDRTVVELKFSVASTVFTGVEDTRFHATESTASTLGSCLVPVLTT